MSHFNELHSFAWLQVRAFAGWPGTTATFHLEASGSELAKDMVVKIIETHVSAGSHEQASPAGERKLKEVHVAKGRFLIPCGDGEVLEVHELQPPGKKPMPASAYINGLKGRRVFVHA
jgi:methionyl-tRNA formyltransferase